MATPRRQLDAHGTLFEKLINEDDPAALRAILGSEKDEVIDLCLRTFGWKGSNLQRAVVEQELASRREKRSRRQKLMDQAIGFAFGTATGAATTAFAFLLGK